MDRFYICVRNNTVDITTWYCNYDLLQQPITSARPIFVAEIDYLQGTLVISA